MDRVVSGLIVRMAGSLQTCLYFAVVNLVCLGLMSLAGLSLTVDCFAQETGWTAYRAKRNLQTRSDIPDLNLVYGRWLLRSRSLNSVYLGFPMTRMTYDKRYILPDPEAIAGPDIVFHDPKVGLRMGPEGVKLAFVGLPYEKKRKLYDINAKVRVRAELFFDREPVANTKVYSASPVGFLLPLEFLHGLDERKFLSRMQEDWQWRLRVYYDGELGYVYSGPLTDASKALAAARDELSWRLKQKQRGGVSLSNDDFW